MRFPRNVKIIRGQIDVAAIASVFFLLILFLMASSLLYIPGVPLRVGQKLSDPARRPVLITRQGQIKYEGKDYSLAATENLKAHIKATPGIGTLVVQAETGAPRELVLLVRDVARALRLEFESQNVPLNLPESSGNVVGAVGSLVVAVNLGGQYFFENQLLTPDQLESRLKKTAGSYKNPPRLVVLADEATENGILVKLADLASRAGINDILMATRPRPYQKKPENR